MDLRYNMATNQQWFGRENSRAGGGGRYRVDQIAALSAKAAKLEKTLIAALSARAAEMEEAMQRAFSNHQPQPCVMCGDRRHSYEYCPQADWDEEPEQFNNPWSNNNCNFYDNAPFNNSNNHTFQSDQPEPYIDPAFMHEQGKFNQMIWDQLQTMSAQLTAGGKLLEQLSHQADFSQPPQFQEPAMPAAHHTNRADSTQTMQPPAEEPEHTDHAEPTRPAETNGTTEHADREDSARTAQKEADNLEELGRGPHESHASRVPHDLEIRGSESEEPDATSVEPDATRVEPDATSVETQTEGPTPKLMPLPPTPELKSLPANLRYEFLDPDKSCFVIISADLEPDRTATPLENLKGAIRCLIKGTKEILRILLMQEFDRVVRVPLKWVLPPVPPDPSPTKA